MEKNQILGCLFKFLVLFFISISEKSLITFRITVIEDFMLNIISCVKMLHNRHGVKFLTCNDDVFNITKGKISTSRYYSIHLKDNKFKNIPNELKQILKQQDMRFNENLMLRSGIITRFFNSIMRVDIPKERMVDVTVVLSWIVYNFFKKYIGKASGMEVITSFWMDE